MSKEVLIVEDDRSLARQLVRTIESAGYRARAVHDGDSALKQVAEAQPDLVLLDLLIPKQDGHAVLSVLQASQATRDLPVLVMSGVFRAITHAEGLQGAGARGFLEKPFSPEKLVLALRAILGAGSEPAVSEEVEGQLSLTRIPAAEVLAKAIREKFTGAVHFKRERVHKLIILDAGQPRAIRSNLAKEALSRRLLDAGRIDQKAFAQSLDRAKRTGRRQGGFLVKMGALTEAELEQALRETVEHKLTDLFTWSDGTAWCQPDIREAPQASEIEHWTAAAMLLAGVEHMSQARMRAALEPYANESVVLQEVQLDRADQTAGVESLLTQLPAPLSVSELMDEHLAALYGMWLMGALRFESKSDEGESELGRELRHLRAEQECQNHFEALGLQNEAATREVRDAFVKLAKRYHPDRFSQESNPVQRLAAEVFARISNAHETLSNPDSRREYISRLKRGTSEQEDREAVARIVRAEKECKEGEALLRKREYAGAVEKFKAALELDDTEGEFHAFYGWAWFLMHRGEGEERVAAVCSLQKGIELAPRSATGYYYLGQLRKTCAETDEAERMFRKVVEVQPDHLEANRELRLLERRREGKK